MGRLLVFHARLSGRWGHDREERPPKSHRDVTSSSPLAGESGAVIPCRGFVPRRYDLKRLAAWVCLLALSAPAVPAEERIDLDMITKIRQEGYKHSQVMDTASELMDRIGPRLTGSPQMKAANEWTRQKLAEWRLANAHLETWGPFGRGWSYEKSTCRMLAPDHAEPTAFPKG